MGPFSTLFHSYFSYCQGDLCELVREIHSEVRVSWRMVGTVAFGIDCCIAMVQMAQLQLIYLIYLLRIVIFNSYVSLPEGKITVRPCRSHRITHFQWKLTAQPLSGRVYVNLLEGILFVVHVFNPITKPKLGMVHDWVSL